jgi:undecaprenyl-diphosphatase
MFLTSCYSILVRARVKRWTDAAARWFSRRDLRLLFELAVIAGLAWLFLEIADAVTRNATQSFDDSVLLALRTDAAGKDPVGPPWLQSALVDLSALGSGGVTALVTVLVFVFLLLARKPRLAVMVAVCALGAFGVMTAFKQMFGRGRPVVVEHIGVTGGLSFPSGHASISAALYVTLAVLLASGLRELRLRVYVVSVGVGLAVLVGFTRVYMGVHYPSDVVAGWAVGLFWALLCGMASRLLQRRGVVEQGSETS